MVHSLVTFSTTLYNTLRTSCTVLVLIHARNFCARTLSRTEFVPARAGKNPGHARPCRVGPNFALRRGWDLPNFLRDLNPYYVHTRTHRAMWTIVRIVIQLCAILELEAYFEKCLLLHLKGRTARRRHNAHPGRFLQICPCRFSRKVSLRFHGMTRGQCAYLVGPQ